MITGAVLTTGILLDKLGLQPRFY